MVVVGESGGTVSGKRERGRWRIKLDDIKVNGNCRDEEDGAK